MGNSISVPTSGYASYIMRINYDDSNIRNILNQAIITKAVLVAHKLGLFEFMGDKPKTFDAICSGLKLAKRSAEALIKVCISQDLIMKQGDVYILSEIAQTYLLANSPVCFGPVLDLIVENDEMTSYQRIKEAIVTGQPQIYQRGKIFEEQEQNKTLLDCFTKAMHSKSIGSAYLWPKNLNLDQYQYILDIGGGSGIHSIGACNIWPKLKAIVYERPMVCDIAKVYIEEHGLTSRISTQSGNMWEDAFPEADIHFYSDIYHDWSSDKCLYLTKKSFNQLSSGGMLIIHEMVYETVENIPPIIAAYNLNMLLWTEGKQYARTDIVKMLKEAGFVNIQTKAIFGTWHIIFGFKPED